MSSDNPVPARGLDLGEFFDDERYSDLWVKDSDGRHWAVHRIIVCGQSPVLANACKPEHGFKEASTGVIELPNDDPAAVAAMLQFLYSGSYPTPDANPLLLSAQAHAMGDIYQIPKLRAHARAEFAELASFADAWETCDLAAAVDVIYESTPESNDDNDDNEDDSGSGMRDLAVDIVCRHFHTLVPDASFAAVLDAQPALAKDVLARLARLNPDGLPPRVRTYACSHPAHNNAHVVRLDGDAASVDANSRSKKARCPKCQALRTHREWQKRLI